MRGEDNHLCRRLSVGPCGIRHSLHDRVVDGLPAVWGRFLENQAAT
jgi:hypothetical protein